MICLIWQALRPDRVCQFLNETGIAVRFFDYDIEGDIDDRICDRHGNSASGHTVL